MLLELSGGREMPSQTIVFVGDRQVPAKYWRHVYPNNGTIVTVRVTVHNGEMARTAAMIAVGVAAVAVSGGALGGLIPALGGGWAAGAAGLAVTAVGMLAINALVPLSSPKFESQTSSPTLSITGARNAEKPFSPVPMILGTYRYTPPLIASSFTSLDGNDQILSMLMTGGYGPITISDMAIGDTPIGSFTGVETQVNEGYQDDLDITLYPGDVQQLPLNLRIYNGTWRQDQGDPHPDANPCTALPAAAYPDPDPNCYMRVTPAPCFKFRVDISLPNGAIQIKDQGDRENMLVDLDIWYRESGTSDPYTLGGSININAKTNSLIRRSVTVTPPAEPTGELAYEVILVRVTLDDREGPDPDGDNTRYSASWWTSLTAYSATDPISDGSQQCLSQIALEIKATSQLNGTVEDFSFLGRTVALDYDGTPGSWSRRTTNNPASLFRYVLQCQANKQRVADCRIDLDALETWHVFCNLRGYRFNMVRDFQSTVLDALTDIAGAGRARPDQIDGKWTVVVDNQDNYVTPVQLFTPRNSWGFSGSKQMIDVPHALRCRFVDSLNEYTQTEVIAYDDGYNELTATRFESIEFPGLTTEAQVLTMGRYQLAVSRLRQERYSLSADVEHVACVPGDSVLVQNDSLKVGYGAARVTEVVGSVITVDSEIDYLDPVGAVHRSNAGVITVVAASGNAITPTNSFTLNPMPPDVNVGDLVTFGELNTETLHVVVDTIIPANDLSATINCYPVAPATDVT